MAYVAPRTWATSDLVTAAMMNQDVRDNMIYVKSRVDALTTVSFVDCLNPVIRAWNTIYQNGSKIRIVIISAIFLMGANRSYDFDIGPTSPPTTRLAISTGGGGGDNNQSDTLTFIIPPNYYYRTNGTMPPTPADWSEFDLF